MVLYQLLFSEFSENHFHLWIHQKKQCMFTTDKSTISKWNVFNLLEICAPTMFRWLAAGSWLRRKCGALHLHLFCICILAIVSLYITMFMCIFKHLYLVIHMSIRNFELEHLYLFIWTCVFVFEHLYLSIWILCTFLVLKVGWKVKISWRKKWSGEVLG